jgi:hypothetical protein
MEKIYYRICNKWQKCKLFGCRGNCIYSIKLNNNLGIIPNHKICNNTWVIIQEISQIQYLMAQKYKKVLLDNTLI